MKSDKAQWGGALGEVKAMQLKLDATTNVIITFKRLNFISIIDGGKSMAFVILFFVQVLCCIVMGLCYMFKG